MIMLQLKQGIVSNDDNSCPYQNEEKLLEILVLTIQLIEVQADPRMNMVNISSIPLEVTFPTKNTTKEKK